MPDTASQNGSTPLRNMRHERFAQCVASGDSAAGAYRRVYTEASPATVETQGPATARMPQVSLRISWLKAAGAAEVTKRFAWEKADALQFALRVVETPIGAVDENDSLCRLAFRRPAVQTGEHRASPTRIVWSLRPPPLP